MSPSPTESARAVAPLPPPCWAASHLYGLGLIARVTPGGAYQYYHTDGLGSTRALTDGAGNLVATYDCDAFGGPRASTPPTNPPPNSYRHLGEALDRDAGGRTDF